MRTDVRRPLVADDDGAGGRRREKTVAAALSEAWEPGAVLMTGACPSKEGRRQGGRTPMQLLADAVDTYEVGNLARWWGWEASSEGRRQLTWSAGARSLRMLADLGAEFDDQEVAAEALRSEREHVLRREVWLEVVARGLEAKILTAAESGPAAELAAWWIENVLAGGAALRGLGPD